MDDEYLRIKAHQDGSLHFTQYGKSDGAHQHISWDVLGTVGPINMHETYGTGKDAVHRNLPSEYWETLSSKRPKYNG